MLIARVNIVALIMLMLSFYRACKPALKTLPPFSPQDRYADAQRLPPLDKENNYVLTGFEESDKKTVLKFNRKFDTCDPRDRKIKVTYLSNYIRFWRGY